MTDPLPPEAVEAQDSPVERFRKRPLEVEMMLWDGTEKRAEELRAWVGGIPDEPGQWAIQAHPGRVAQLWVHSRFEWVALPVGYRVAKDDDGDGFVRVSPAAAARIFDPAPEPLELTPEEQAAASRSEHMSTCHEEACVECMKELRAIRRIVKAVRPVIEADERRKLYPAVVQRLLNTAAWHAPIGLADPAEISATDLAIAEAFRSEAKAWQKAADDGSPVAAASIPTLERPDTEGGVER